MIFVSLSLSDWFCAHLKFNTNFIHSHFGWVPRLGSWRCTHCLYHERIESFLSISLEFHLKAYFSLRFPLFSSLISVLSIYRHIQVHGTVKLIGWTASKRRRHYRQKIGRERNKNCTNSKHSLASNSKQYSRFNDVAFIFSIVPSLICVNRESNKNFSCIVFSSSFAPIASYFIFIAFY